MDVITDSLANFKVMAFLPAQEKDKHNMSNDPQVLIRFLAHRKWFYS